MTRFQRLRRGLAVMWWRAMNPAARLIARRAPWWVLLETTGRTSGAPRRTPLATGPADPDGMWLLAVHGRHAGWVRNLEQSPRVRLRHRRTWRVGEAVVHALDADIVRRFNAYARSGARGPIALDPLLVRVTFDPAPEQGA